MRGGGVGGKMSGKVWKLGLVLLHTPGKGR